MTTKVTRDVLDVTVRPITTIDINGGTIDGTPIGATTASTGRFTTLNATNLTVTGSVNFTGATTSGITAFYADVAERYKRDKVYDPGTVVRLGGINEITESDGRKHALGIDTEVFGVIRTEPAWVLNGKPQDDPSDERLMLPVALLGRVPCWVVGPVFKGDRLYAVHGGVATVLRGADPKLAFARSLVTSRDHERRLIEVAIITIK